MNIQQLKSTWLYHCLIRLVMLPPQKKVTCAAKQLRTLQSFEMISYPQYSANNSLYNKDYTFSPSIMLTAFSRVIYASFFPGD